MIYLLENEMLLKQNLMKKRLEFYTKFDLYLHKRYANVAELSTQSSGIVKNAVLKSISQNRPATIIRER